MKKIKGLLYCCKAKPYLIQGLAKPMHTLDATNPFNFNWKLVNKGFSNDRLNGKIIAECDFEVEEIEKIYGSNHACFDKDGYFDDYADYVTKSLEETELLKHSCLTSEELENYLQDKNGYALHIKNLHIFDEPRDIRNYYNIATRTMADCMNQKALLKAPKNMCDAYDVYKNHYIVISIQPQWLCKILNGEKDIEVRKDVLKEMLDNASK